MRDILILNCKEIVCLKVLLFVITEMCEAFKTRGYNVKVIDSIKDITNNSVVFMGSTIMHSDPASLLNQVAPDAIYIGWYWGNINTSQLKYFIYTYENMFNPDDRVKLLKTKIANCPLLLRASDNPDLIGTYERNVLRDYCYMGWNYCPNLIPSEPYKGLYHGVSNHDLFLGYSQRREIYLSSIFALGFQGNDNIVTKHVGQRMYEGMAYGCIVLSNSPAACEQTNNIVVYIDSKGDLENKMKYFKENPDMIKKKQEEGYKFIKEFGTNHYAIDKFIECINKSYGISI